MADGKLRVGVAQMRETGDLGKNLREIGRFVARARADGVELLSFPETALGGYGPAYHESSAGWDPDALDAALREVRELARENNMALLLGTHLPLEGSWSNSAVLIRPDGRLGGTYDKVHLYGREAEYYRAGRAPARVAGACGALIGIQICFDARFPEPFRLLSLGGAQVLFILSHVLGRGNDWKGPVYEAHVSSRAAENGRYVVFADAAGRTQNVPSLIAGPRGDIIARAPRRVSALLTATLNLGQVHDDFLRARRPETYRRARA